MKLISLFFFLNHPLQSSVEELPPNLFFFPRKTQQSLMCTVSHTAHTVRVATPSSGLFLCAGRRVQSGTQNYSMLFEK